MILFLTDASVDYGPDYLIDGFYRLFGVEHVVDYPVKSSLHGLMTGFDCDLNWLRCASYDDPAFVPDMILSDRVELFVFPTLRGNVPPLVRQWASVGLLDKLRDCTVCYDAEDHSSNTKAQYVDALGYEPVAYFKRELPLGETWAMPLPFGYPEERMVPVVGSTPRSGVAYSAFIWPGTEDGVRARLRHALLKQTDGAGITAMWLADERISVQADHALHQGALVAVSPAGAGSGTNRHLQCIADGVAPVMQRPTVQVPNWFHEGSEALFFDDVDDCMAQVGYLLRNPAHATSMALAAQRCLRQHHTTAARARTVWHSVHQ